MNIEDSLRIIVKEAFSEVVTPIMNDLRTFLTKADKTKEESDEDLLTITEAAKFLNKKKSTMYSYNYQNSIPYTKNGGTILYRRKDLKNFMRGIPSRRDIEKKV